MESYGEQYYLMDLLPSIVFFSSCVIICLLDLCRMMESYGEQYYLMDLLPIPCCHLDQGQYRHVFLYLWERHGYLYHLDGDKLCLGSCHLELI